MTDKEVRSLFFDSHFADQPIKELPCDNLSREEWLSYRTSLLSLGGSDMGTILGLNKYKDVTRLYFEMIDPMQRYITRNNTDSIFAFWGRAFEDKIADMWQYHDGDDESMMLNESKGYKVKEWRKRDSMIYNEDYPFIVANIDGEIVNHPLVGSGILEIKTISGYAYDMWQSIPPYYYLQPQAYMIATGSDYAEIAALRDGRHLEVYCFDANINIQNRIIEEAYAFMERVEKGRSMDTSNMTKEKFFHHALEWAPEPSNADYTEFLKENKNLRDARNDIDADTELEEMALEYLSLKEGIKENKGELETLEQLIKYRLTKDSAVRATSPKIRITWKNKFLVRRQ